MKTKKKTLKKRWSAKKLIGLCVMMLALCSLFAVGAFADQATPTSLEASAGMTDLIEAIFDSFTTVITGLGSGLKEAFSNIIYVDPAATSPVFSPLVIFIFVMSGLGLATGVFYKIFGVIRARRG